MKISVMGLGYVGAVSSACLARDGHEVIGVDLSASKVETINAGRSPIVEAGLAELIASGVASGALRATNDPIEAVNGTDLSLICVGTPGRTNGNLNVEFLHTVGRQIGEAVRQSGRSHIVVVRSTVLPGTVRGTIIPALTEGFGGNFGDRIKLAVNPEFLREGSAIEDYLKPPKTIVGSDDADCAELVAGIYAHLSAPVFKTSIEVAEMAKYVDNSWHALKVTFANEMGWLCSRLGVDSRAVIELFLSDTKLNISPYYLRPGFAFGGSCLPKDVRALSYKAKSVDLSLPVLENILNSNQAQIGRVIELIATTGARRVAMIGLTFKAKTDDVRESPYVEVAERLIGKGYALTIFDPNISLPSMVGANKVYADRMIPHLSQLLVHSAAEAVKDAELVVVAHSTEASRAIPAMLRDDQILLDLAGLATRSEFAGRYIGIN
jgi:GDP-mannose 6-dehydrogenase